MPSSARCLLHAACCVLPRCLVACCQWSFPKFLLHAARCPLHAACCMLRCTTVLSAACCLKSGACCLLHAVCYVLHAVHCMAHVACRFLLHAACRPLHFPYCALHVAWCLLHTLQWCLARCPLRVVCGIAVRWIGSAARCLWSVLMLPAQVPHVAWCALSVCRQVPRSHLVWYMFCVSSRLLHVA